MHGTLLGKAMVVALVIEGCRQPLRHGKVHVTLASDLQVYGSKSIVTCGNSRGILQLIGRIQAVKSSSFKGKPQQHSMPHHPHWLLTVLAPLHEAPMLLEACLECSHPFFLLTTSQTCVCAQTLGSMWNACRYYQKQPPESLLCGHIMELRKLR